MVNQSDSRITNKIIGFAHLARSEGFKVGIQETCDALAAANIGLLTPKSAFKYTLRSLMCSTREEFERFDVLFEGYWQRWSALGQQTIAKKISQTYTVEPKNHSLIMSGQEEDDKVEEEGKKVTGASAIERLQKTDLSEIPHDELEKFDELARQLWQQMNRRVTRRMKKQQRKERIYLRGTFRKNIANGGDPIQLEFRSRARVKPRLVVLLDVSGSMDQYSFFFLKFVYSLQKHFERVESFIFSTRLLHITKALTENGLGKTLKALESQADAWSSGTRIGECLRTFNLNYAKRILTRKSILVVLSDGLDTGEPELFRQQLQQIKRRARKVIWLNPLLGMDNYEPATRGLNAALPLIDVFISAHNLNSLLELEKHLIHV